ncbi:MAG: dephospho-CoA kinase [Chitinophagaceae bacterium]|nr:dephospho-CoA kinase [Chitinophagaceae bacterium]
MLKVGITGGIGSGKSVVSRIFEVLGLPVYYADAEAKRLMQEDGPLRQQIIRHFGEAAYRNNQLDRAWLAAQVFGDESRVRLLNSLVHPAVIAHAAQWMEARRQEQRYPYVLKEAALFFESGSAGEMDYIVGVFAPRNLRLQRVMQRDGAGRQEVLARMDKQIDESLKMKLCDFVLANDEQQLLIPQVLQVHQTLLEKVSAI